MSELLDKMMTIADRAIHARVGTKDVMMPVWHLMHADGKSEVIGTPWANSNEKWSVFEVIRATIKATDVIAYAVTVEAWMPPKPLSKAEVAAIAPDGDINQLRPSMMPDRVECFVATVSDGTKTLAKMWDIRRDKRGRVKAVIPRDDLAGEGAEFQGALSTMLNT